MDNPPEQRKSLAELAQGEGSEPGGIVCPRCGWACLPVVYTRRLATGQTQRVRECRRCRQRVLCREKVITRIDRDN